MKILTANDQAHFQKAGGYRAYIQMQIRQKWGALAPSIVWSRAQGDVKAFIVRSQWAAECPDCKTPSLVDIHAPFFCPQCLMRDNMYRPRTLVLPEDKQTIETLLVKRLDPGTRNWELHETVDDLQRENLENGVK